MNRIESTETGPHIHGQLIFNNSVPHAGTTRFAYAKKKGTSIYTSHYIQKIKMDHINMN